MGSYSTMAEPHVAQLALAWEQYAGKYLNLTPEAARRGFDAWLSKQGISH